MSSILEALKKVEKDTVDQEPEEFSWPQPLDVRRTIGRGLSRRYGVFYRPYKLALLFFFTTTIVLAALLILPEILPYPVEQNIPATQTKAISVKESPKTIIVEKTDDGVQTFESIPAKKETPAEQTAQPDNAESSTKPELAIASPVEKQPEALAEAFIPNGKSSGLTLHGLSWSEDPAKRMAVINASIAKEGSMIEGAIVRRIDQKQVIVEKNGETMFLTFDKY